MDRPRLTSFFKESGKKPFFVCDVSPPRLGMSDSISGLLELDPDMFSVSYNPGRSTIMNSVIAATWLQTQTGIETMFTLATRDMNKLALQSLMLGAQFNSLNNVVIVQGDKFSEEEALLACEINDFTPTEMIKATTNMNSRKDFRGRYIHEPTDFLIGAVFDLNKPWERESYLVGQKIKAGADFLIAQPFYDIENAQKFMDYYLEVHDQPLDLPIFWGLQMLEKGSGSFCEVPAEISESIDRGISTVELATQFIEKFQQLGIGSFYLIPPFFKGGRRSYLAAQTLLEEFRN